jgi:small conductance mechanosensitive channel
LPIFRRLSPKQRFKPAINVKQTLMEQKTYIDQLIDLALQFGPKIVSALLILIVGMWIIRRVVHSFDKVLEKRNVDESLRPFFISLIDVALKVAMLLVVASQAGIETTSFIAIFSAIAFAVGLALQGSLGNFASGVLILLFRPYTVGDLLTIDGQTGYVTEIQIFNTILTTEHGKKVIIPNGKVTEGSIENIAMGVEVQVEVTILLDSNTAVSAIREATAAAAASCPWLVEGRESEVVISGISRDDMKVDIAWWTIGEHYIHTLDFIHEALREAFETRGIQVAKERRREMIE